MSVLDTIFLKYRTILAGLSPLPQRSSTSFVGDTVELSDDPDNDRTIVTITAATGGGELTIQDAGSAVGTFSIVNFASGATVTDAGGGVADIDVAGGIVVKNAGSPIGTFTALNLISGATAADSGGGVAGISVTGGGGSIYRGPYAGRPASPALNDQAIYTDAAYTQIWDGTHWCNNLGGIWLPETPDVALFTQTDNPNSCTLANANGQIKAFYSSGSGDYYESPGMAPLVTPTDCGVKFAMHMYSNDYDAGNETLALFGGGVIIWKTGGPAATMYWWYRSTVAGYDCAVACASWSSHSAQTGQGYFEIKAGDAKFGWLRVIGGEIRWYTSSDNVNWSPVPIFLRTTSAVFSGNPTHIGFASGAQVANTYAIYPYAEFTGI